MRTAINQNHHPAGVLLPPLDQGGRRRRMPAARGRQALALLMAALLVSASFLPRVEAAAGDPDPTFDLDGKVTTDFVLQGFGSTFDQAEAVAVQSDGKIVAAGTAGGSAGLPNFALARYTSNGTLDPTFGDGGKVTTDFGGDDYGQAMAIQDDGKIVVVGQATLGSGGDFALARYNPDGSLDMTFGPGGMVTLDLSSGDDDIAEAVAIEGDGQIVVGGRAHDLGFGAQFALARFNSDGSLDTLFGMGGVVTHTLGADGIRDLALQSDGKIVAVGGDPALLVRYNSDGTLDSGFGVGGMVATAGESAVALQSDGKVVTAGNIGNTDFAVVRYGGDGNLDMTFGGGLATVNFFGFNDSAQDMVIQSDGKIVVAGRANTGIGSNFGVARLDTNGNLDPMFGAGGKATTDFFGEPNVDHAFAVALQSDGKIVAAGLVTGDPDGEFNFGLARYDGGPIVAAPCPQPQGYWKNNPAAWPVTSLTLGTQTYTQAELLAILNTSTTKDASLILARQLIAAKLNLAAGSDSAPVSSTIAHADSLFSGFNGKLPYKVKPPSVTGQAMTADAVVLDNYNKALLTPGCNP